MSKLNDIDIPQWAILISCGILAFLGQWLFVFLTSKSAATELATHELRQMVAVQRADFESSRRMMDQQLTTFNVQIQNMYAEITKKLDRMEARQEELGKAMARQPLPGHNQ
jgi:hypothetical protein